MFDFVKNFQICSVKNIPPLAIVFYHNFSKEKIGDSDCFSGGFSGLVNMMILGTAREVFCYSRTNRMLLLLVGTFST